MRTATKTFLFLALIAGLLTLPANAQMNTITTTTLNGAIDDLQKTVVLASATGVTTSTILYVDREAMRVDSTYNGTSTTVPVIRGTDGTMKRGHLTATVVYIGRPNWFQTSDISGSCTLASLYVHPWVNIRTGNTFECQTSKWIVTNGPAASGVGLTSLTPNAANTVDAGSALLPWRKLYLGTAATNNFVFTPAATAAARVITIPDPLGAATIAFTNPAAGLSQMFTNTSLTSPAITTDIRATTAGAATVGTAAKPFGSAILGTAATNNLTITPAAFAAGVTATVDDPGIAAVKLPTAIRGTGTFTAAAIGAGACGGVVTVAAAGLADTSVVYAALNKAPDAESKKGLTYWAYPTAGNVNIVICNGTAGALTPAADLVFNWIAFTP